MLSNVIVSRFLVSVYMIATSFCIILSDLDSYSSNTCNPLFCLAGRFIGIIRLRHERSEGKQITPRLGQYHFCSQQLFTVKIKP